MVEASYQRPEWTVARRSFRPSHPGLEKNVRLMPVQILPLSFGEEANIPETKGRQATRRKLSQSELFDFACRDLPLACRKQFARAIDLLAVP
jgi:hypothetical protein